VEECHDQCCGYLVLRVSGGDDTLSSCGNVSWVRQACVMGGAHMHHGCWCRAYAAQLAGAKTQMLYKEVGCTQRLGRRGQSEAAPCVAPLTVLVPHSIPPFVVEDDHLSEVMVRASMRARTIACWRTMVCCLCPSTGATRRCLPSPSGPVQCYMRMLQEGALGVFQTSCRWCN